MRNRILAGLGVAALATVGIAAPAAADSHTSDIFVVHGIPGLTVDVYVNGDLTLEGFEPLGVAGPLALPAGDYEIEVFEAGADPEVDAAAITETETVPDAGLSVSLVAQYDAAGTPIIGAFVNDTSETAAGEGRLSIRHAAAAPAVDVFVNDAPLEGFAGVENGGAGDVDVPADTYSAFVAAAGTTDPAIGPADVTIEEGVNTIVYAVGSLELEDATFAVQTIDVHAAAVDGVPAGGAGLVAENNGAGFVAAGIALLVALLAAAGIIARRELVASK